MTEEEYFEQRLNDQLAWYEKKSGINKRLFMRFRATEIILALLIPFLTGFMNTEYLVSKLIIGSLGVVVAAIASIMTLYKFQENWIEYRSTSESLKYEKFLYLTRSGDYKENATLQNFVERIESILSKENSRWATNNTSAKESTEPTVKE